MTGRYLSSKEVADQLGLHNDTLKAWRARDEGPPYFRMGRAIRYRPEEVEKWLEEKRVDGGA